MRQLIWLLTALSLALVLWVEFRTRLSRSLKIAAWFYLCALGARLIFGWSSENALVLGLVLGVGGVIWLAVWYVTERIIRGQTQK